MRGAAWAGRPGAQECGSSGRSAAAGLSHRSPPASPPPPRAMAGSSSLEAVRRKIRSLQEQADAAEERAGSLQRELDYERKLRETVRDPPIAHPPPPRAASAAGGPTSRCRALQSPSTPAPTPAGRTWCTWGSWRLALGRGLFFSALPFHRSWFKVKAPSGSRSGVEKVLEAALSQKGLYLGVICIRPGYLGSPGMCTFALLAVFTRRVGREEGNPFGNPFRWKGALTGQVWGTARP